jgi:hypothetical protein
MLWDDMDQTSSPRPRLGCVSLVAAGQTRGCGNVKPATETAEEDSGHVIGKAWAEKWRATRLGSLTPRGKQQ